MAMTNENLSVFAK